MSVAVIIGFIILTVFGVRHGVKKYRRTKGYQKVDTEIPLREMNHGGQDDAGMHRNQSY